MKALWQPSRAWDRGSKPHWTGSPVEWTSWQRLSTGHQSKRKIPLGQPIGGARPTGNSRGASETDSNEMPEAGPHLQDPPVRGEGGAQDPEDRPLQDPLFVLDPVGPLVQLLEQTETGTVSQEEVAETITSTIQLLGNTSVQISRLRRKKVLKEFNPDIQDLADDDNFEGSAPKLFGRGLEVRAKERTEAVRLLNLH